MKDQVRQLAEQAGIIYGSAVDYYYTRATDGVTSEQMAKFAELIIRECADIVDKMDSIRLESFHRRDGSKVVTGHVLKQHFGIKE